MSLIQLRHKTKKPQHSYESWCIGLIADDHMVHTSAGNSSAKEYLQEQAAEYLIHSWDLAAAIGVDRQLAQSW